ncbi:MAG: transposase [Planctomycetes bacterium]|nr:transposase [Planctomycetota bacterium]
MRHQAIQMTGPMRKCVREAITQHRDFKHWQLSALNVRTNHVHVVVSAPDATASHALNSLKARATRRLRDCSLLKSDQPIWTSRGSQVVLKDLESFNRAVHYVNFEQGPALPDE